jgi:hypothetical protein
VSWFGRSCRFSRRLPERDVVYTPASRTRFKRRRNWNAGAVYATKCGRMSAFCQYTKRTVKFPYRLADDREESADSADHLTCDGQQNLLNLLPKMEIFACG